MIMTIKGIFYLQRVRRFFYRFRCPVDEQTDRARNRGHTTTPEPTSDVNVTWGMWNLLAGGSCSETVVSLWVTAVAARLSTPGMDADRGGGWFLRLAVDVLLYTSSDSWFPHDLRETKTKTLNKNNLNLKNKKT